MNAGNNVKVLRMLFLKYFILLKINIVLNIKRSGSGVYIRICKNDLRLYNDKSIEILLLSCFAAADQKESSGIYLRRKMGKTLGIIYN